VWVEEDPEDGDAVFVEDVDTGYVYTSTAWTPFSGASAYNWGAGLSNDGLTINVGAGDGITVTVDDVALTTPGTLTISSTNAAAGNHTHAITTLSNPGAAAAILASAADGGIQLLRMGLGADGDTDNRITMVDGGQIGQTDGLLMEFDDSSNYLEITGGNVGIGITNPTSLLEVSGGDISIDAGQKINVEGASGNTYMAYDSVTGRLNIYVNGEIVAYYEN